MTPLGQNELISRCVGRYGLGDTRKCPNRSTTSIDRSFTAIAMRVRKGLALIVAATQAKQRLVIGVGEMEGRKRFGL